MGILLQLFRLPFHLPGKLLRGLILENDVKGVNDTGNVTED